MNSILTLGQTYLEKYRWIIDRIEESFGKGSVKTKIVEGTSGQGFIIGIHTVIAGREYANAFWAERNIYIDRESEYDDEGIMVCAPHYARDDLDLAETLENTSFVEKIIKDLESQILKDAKQEEEQE